MITKSVTYTDFENKQHTQKLYFNLSKADLLEQITMIPQLQELSALFEEGPHELSVTEIRKLLDVTKLFIRLGYGIKLPSGGFRKNEEVFQEFKDSGAHDEFLFDLFNKPAELFDFLTGMMPRPLLEEAISQMKTTNPDVVRQLDDVNLLSASIVAADPLPGQGGIQEVSEPQSPVEDTRPAWIREDREPTDVEVRNMSQDELRQAYLARVNRK